MVPVITSAGHYSRQWCCRRRSARNRRIRRGAAPADAAGRAPIRACAPLVARRVTELLREHTLASGARSAAARGARHPAPSGEPRRPPCSWRRRCGAGGVAGEVVAAFLDDEPPLADALRASSARTAVLVVPFLIGGGSHAARGHPAAVGLEPAGAAAAGRSVAGADRRRPSGRHASRHRGHHRGSGAPAHSASAPALPPRRGTHPGRVEPGTVHLVGGGPGDPGLITARGLELLRRADVVVHDRLIGPELLRRGAGRRRADRRRQGARARAATRRRRSTRCWSSARGPGRTVVRLKGGDPFVFGRGSEELEACRAAGVPVRGGARRLQRHRGTGGRRDPGDGARASRGRSRW